MPVVRVAGGYKSHSGAKTVYKRRRDAQRQLQAIKASQARQAKRQSYK